MTGRYAEKTAVSMAKSQEEIERILRRFGAHSQIWARDDDVGLVVVAFKRGDRTYKFSLHLPKRTDDAIRFTPSGRWDRTPKQIDELVEAETRRLFRSLTNYIKAMLDAIDSGIISEDKALLPYLLLPSGETMAEHLEPQVARMLESGIAPSILRALPEGR